MTKLLFQVKWDKENYSKRLRYQKDQPVSMTQLVGLLLLMLMIRLIIEINQELLKIQLSDQNLFSKLLM